MKTEDIAKFYVHLGRRIKAYRKEAKIPQARVAAALGLSRVAVTNIEAGRQRVLSHHIVTLCQLFQIEPTIFLAQ